MLEAFDLPFAQRGLAAVLVLSLAAGVLGTWIVLRGLAFFSHAVGTAAFPGLVLAEGLGFAATFGALGAAAVVACLVAWLARRRPDSHESATALVLVAALALGAILASDVFGSQGGVDTLLFGSLLAIGTGELALAAVAAAAVLVATALLGPAWLTTGFDAGAARAAGLRSVTPDLVLLGLVALVAVAALSLVGALLATALLVVPAATTRLLTDRLRAWQLATVGLAAIEGVAGLLLAIELNAPPGATIAVIAGAGFALAWLWRSRRMAVAGVAATAVLAGCGGGPAGDERPVVVASTPQVADIARQVAGERFRVVTLLRPGTDPHDYEPRPDDVRAVTGAELVVGSGLGLDPWLDDVVKGAGGGPQLLRLGEQVPVRLPGSGDEKIDPHWWHDPRNVAAAAGELAEALDLPAPDAYRSEVTSMATELRACLRRIPRERRLLVTDHDAFAYFAHAFDLRILGAVIPSTSSQAQASAGALAELTTLVREREVPAVFPAAGLNADLARALAERTGARVGDPLLADTLGDPGTPEATLLGAARANADAVARGLSADGKGCT